MEENEEPQETMQDAIVNGLQELNTEQPVEEPVIEEQTTTQVETPPAQEIKPEDSAKLAGEKPADIKPEDKDELLRRMPPGLSPNAQNRFRELSKTVKELREENTKLKESGGANEVLKADYESMKAAQEGFVKVLEEHHTTPDHLNQFLLYNSLVQTGQYDKALEIMDQERANLALRLGRPLEGVDALSSFPDLKQAVENYQMTPEHAMQLARYRNDEQMRSAQGQQQEAREQQSLQAKQEHDQAVTAVKSMTEKWAGSDIDWKRKEAMILEELPKIMEKYKPINWPDAIEMYYNAISKTAAAAKQQQPAVAQPLRSSSAGTQKPSSMFDAISQGLGWNG